MLPTSVLSRSLKVDVKVQVTALAGLPKDLKEFREDDPVLFRPSPALNTFTEVQVSIARELSIELALRMMIRAGIRSQDMIAVINLATGLIEVHPFQNRIQEEPEN